MKLRIIGFLLILAGLSACKNDLEVNAPWKETAVIYGLLDQGDTAHFIRIERIYQNTGQDAIKAAQFGDSLYFDTLQVELTALNNGKPVWTEVLTPDFTIPKDPGLFANTPNILYKSIRALNPRNYYFLKVRSPKTGKEYTASTALVGYCYLMSQPKAFHVAPWKNYNFQIFAGTNAEAYDLKVTMNYREYDSLTLDSTDHELSYVAVASQSVNANDLIMTIVGRSLYDFIAFKIPVKKGIYRKMVRCSFDFVGGGSELMNYIDINKPSLGIVQKKPEYTNISNGLGLFSSRNTLRYQIPANDSMNYYLRLDSVTKPLNFRFR